MRRQISSKSDSCTEGAGVQATDHRLQENKNNLRLTEFRTSNVIFLFSFFLVLNFAFSPWLLNIPTSKQYHDTWFVLQQWDAIKIFQPDTTECGLNIVLL